MHEHCIALRVVLVIDRGLRGWDEMGSMGMNASGGRETDNSCPHLHHRISERAGINGACTIVLTAWSSLTIATRGISEQD